METNNNNPYLILGENSFKTFTDELNKILEISLRENAKPPIKEEITKGKLKYRGISLVIQHDGSRYLAQRGKRISKIIKMPQFGYYLKDAKLTKEKAKEFLAEWRKDSGILYYESSKHAKMAHDEPVSD